MIAIGLLLVSLVAASNAQVLGFGPCPNVTVMPNLDVSKMNWRWYTYERYYAFFDDGKCASHTLLDVSIAQLLLSISANKATSVESWHFGGTVSLGALFPGVFVAVYYSPTTQITIPIPYQILSTDYTSYAIGHFCADIGIANAKIVWLFTRAKVPSAAVLEKAYASLDALKIDRKHLTKVDHSSCSWLHRK